MEIAQYGKELENLAKDMLVYLQSSDERVFSVFEKMEKIAEEKEDSALFGYLYFYYACAYYGWNNHEKMMEYIHKAVQELMRSNEIELVARTFNLFAIEAHRYGCFSIAYQYYNLAETMVEHTDLLHIKALLKTNIGDLLTELGDPKAGCKSTEEALSLFEEAKQEDSINYLLATINYGLHNIYAGRINDARNALKKVESIIKHTEIKVSSYEGWLLILRAHMAVHDRDEEKMDQYIEGMVHTIIESSFLSNYIKEIYRFCSILIENKEWDKASVLIEAIEKNTKGNTLAYFDAQLAYIKIELSRALNQRKNVIELYRERQRLDNAFRQDENMLYYESIGLMRIIDELRIENMEVQKENIQLQQKAESDSLTGIPNRHALSRVLEESFNQALVEKSYFGVGIVDIDDFKKYNDENGHLAGDACLVSVANTLETIANDFNIFVSRYGGDEFVFVYKGLLNRQIKKIEKEINDRTHVPVTHGFHNTIPDEHTKPWDFFVKADEILYRKKHK
ncbi:MAG: GGDEF domain-containing protein [Solobacterium sp.]|nr:GGDEF domain-containing protein [Solobacterium sp.]